MGETKEKATLAEILIDENAKLIQKLLRNYGIALASNSIARELSGAVTTNTLLVLAFDDVGIER